MREKLLLIAERIRRVENETNVDLMRPREILRAVREAIEDELADPVAMYVCEACGSKWASDNSYIEPHKPSCPSAG